jgi:Acetyltransferases|tara:strand:+ start:616 stop:1182 length:567 start_codon:yes stop_codon:yes gene_type:complete
MEFKILYNNYTNEELLSLAKLHKSILTDSIATNMSANSLAKIYDFLIKKNLLLVGNIIQDRELIGSISLVMNKISLKNLTLDFLKIFLHIGLSYVRRPINTLAESFQKYFAYKNIDYDINIIFLFVDHKHRRKNLASELINFVMKELKGTITVDTNRTNSNAVGFYKKNGFTIVRETKKKVVLKLEKI